MLTEDCLEIQDNSSLHHYRTEIPNIIFLLNLDPYEFKTYCVLKMTAGDRGSCFKSMDVLCKEVGCQKPKLIEIKESLVKRGLILIRKRRHANGGTMPDLITIIDIWGMNMKTMAEKYPAKGGGNPGLQGGVIYDYGGGNLGLPKQELKEQEKKQQQAAPPVAAVSLDQQLGNSEKFTIYPELDEVDIPEADKIEVTSKYARFMVKNAIEWATHPETKISTTLVQAIKWACKNKPKVPKNKVDESNQNKQYAEKHDEMKSDIGMVQAMQSCVQIVYTTCQKEPTGIKYEEKGFFEKFASALRKIDITPLPA